MLLEAYAFGKVGQIMPWGAIASFALAAIMFVLVRPRLSHAPRRPSEAQMPEFTPTTAA